MPEPTTDTRAGRAPQGNEGAAAPAPSTRSVTLAASQNNRGNATAPAQASGCALTPPPNKHGDASAAPQGDEGAATSSRPQLSGLVPLVGLGFWQAWWMTLSSTSHVMGPVDLGPSPMMAVLVVSLLGYVAATLAAPRLAPYGARPALPWVAAGLGTAGTVILAVCTHLSLPGAGLALELCGCVLTAAFSALVLLMWGERWSTLASGDVGRQLVYSFLLAFVLYFVVAALPVVPGCAAVAAFPLLSALALQLSRSEPARGDVPVSTLSFDARRLVALLVALVVISVVFGAMQRVSAPQGSTRELQMLAMAVAGGFTALFALVMLAGGGAADPFSFYRPIFPAIACGAALCLALPGSASFVGNGVLIFGIYCLDMFIMFAASDLAYRARKQVALVFGAAVVATRLGTLIGSYLGWRLLDWAAWDATLRVSIIALFIVAVVLMEGFMFTETGLRALYKPQAAQARVLNLDERCAELARDAGLSARELDVMRLLARGRSIAVISDTLGIAQGTVKHHASNTYRKLGVYDRQSLIDLTAKEPSGE